MHVALHDPQRPFDFAGRIDFRWLRIVGQNDPSLELLPFANVNRHNDFINGDFAFCQQLDGNNIKACAFVGHRLSNRSHVS